METVYLSPDMVEDFGDAAIDPTNPSFASLRRVVDLLRTPQADLATLHGFWLALRGQLDAAEAQIGEAESKVPTALRQVMQPRFDGVRSILEQLREVLVAVEDYLEDPQDGTLDEIQWQLDRVSQDAATAFEAFSHATRSAP